MSAKANRRKPSARLVKRNCTYTVEEISNLFGIHQNTVRNWLANGLRSIDKRRPTLVHGSDLAAYLQRMRRKRKSPCGVQELYCFKCREPRLPSENKVTLERQRNQRVRLVGICEQCGTRMYRAGSHRKVGLYGEIFHLQTRQSEHITVCAEPALNCELETED